MTPEELKAQQELIEKINKEIGDKYPSLKEFPATMQLVAKLEKDMAALKTPSDYEEFKKASTTQFEELGKQLKAIAEKAAPQNLSYKAQIAEFFEKNATEIKALYKEQKSLSLELKVVGNISTASGAIISDVPQYPIWGAPDFNLIGNFIDQFITVSGTNQPAYYYTEMLPKDGDFSFLLEGGTKPEIDFKWETSIVQPTKVAAWERLTEEVVTDVPRIQSLATQYLLKKHNIKKQRGIISGTGVSPIPKGMIYYGRHFNASTIGATVVAPNIFDVINACAVDIATTHNYQDEIPYTVNLVMMHPIDYFRYVQSAKDDDKRPLFNYEALAVNQSVGQITNGWNNNPVSSGIKIIPTAEIPIGNILVCDGSKYNSVNYVPYTVRIGWINDDFIKNQFVILGESRFYAFVKRLDQQAFIYDNISTIQNAIEGTLS